MLTKEAFIGVIVFAVIYLLVINTVEFILMYIDKERAIERWYRISERTFFLVAILGGSLGAVLGMQVFRHKTKHKNFTFGMPAILLVQFVFLLLLKIFVV